MMARVENTARNITHADDTGAPDGVEGRVEDRAVDNSRVLSQTEREHILDIIEKSGAEPGTMWVTVLSYWNGELRWARNRASMTSDRRDISIFVFRTIRHGKGMATTNQTDPVSLAAVARAAEREALKGADRSMRDKEFPSPIESASPSTTWSDTTFNTTVEQRGTLVQQLTEQAEANQLFSAGYLESHGATLSRLSIDDYGRRQVLHAEITQAQCSVTVRHPKGTGSGWAGVSGFDLAKIDEAAVAKRALDKCMTSLEPVRIEPGRYTTILEPQAVADLMQMLLGEQSFNFNRPYLNGPFSMGVDESIQRIRTKLGLRVVDERITISHDPSDIQLGIVAEPGMKPITWIERGVLKTLEDDRGYALNDRNESSSNLRRGSYRMSGGTTTMEEMIATTKRGLIVTRFSSVRLIDQVSLLSTGLTRDGLWLVENGKITKAVKNFRFTESPLFMLNNVDQLGVPVPVFNPNIYPKWLTWTPAFALKTVIVPPLKVNDFSFTSTIDAI